MFFVTSDFFECAVLFWVTCFVMFSVTISLDVKGSGIFLALFFPGCFLPFYIYSVSFLCFLVVLGSLRRITFRNWNVGVDAPDWTKLVVQA